MTASRLPPIHLAALIVLLWAASAAAHFNLNMNVRIFHVEHGSEDLTIYLRTPMAYLVADRVGPTGADGLPAPAPFTTNRMEEGRPVHLVDWNALRADPLGLARIVAEGLVLEAEGRRWQGRVVRLRAYPIGQEPGFATLEEAKRALAEAAVSPEGAGETYVGDTIVDVQLDYAGGGAIVDYSLASRLDPGLPGQDETANLILDHGPGGTEVFRVQGLMRGPLAASRSPVAAASTFVWEGGRHILGGLDHVLFVLCLVLGAVGLRSLIARVTGFTLGHSITLTAGFFGFVPNGAWFVPAVETGIALSIIYAAVIAIRPRSGLAGSPGVMFLVTCAIGLLHGLGFSFVLHEILRIDAPNIWQSLLAFNLGVEIGQMAIVVVAWPALFLLQRTSVAVWRLSRVGAAAGCIAVASLWAVERILFGVGTL